MKRVVALLLLVASVASADTKLRARELVSPDGAQIVAAVAGAVASTSHPQGTLLVATSKSVEELDIASGSALSTQPFGCDALESHAGMIVGICGDDVVSFDAHGSVQWRAHWPATADSYGRRIFVDSGLVIAALRVSYGLTLHVAQTSGVVVSAVDTHVALGAGDQVDIHVHGAVVGRVIPRGWHVRTAIFSLSSDAKRLAHSVVLLPTDVPYDDGAHMHVIRDRDYTLNDALVIISSVPLSPPVLVPAGPIIDADGLGGSGIAEELDVGRVHVWRTFGCCGSQGGVYVAVRPLQ